MCENKPPSKKAQIIYAQLVHDIRIIGSADHYCRPCTIVLVVGLLLGEVFGLLLLLGEEGAQPVQRIARDDQAGGDHRLSSSHEAIAAALLVFIAPCLEDVVLALEGHS